MIFCMLITISDIFLTYAQCFDVVPHLNPKYSVHAGLFPESVMSMFSPKQAVCAGGVPLVEIYFSGSNHCTSAGIVVRTTKINFNTPGGYHPCFTIVCTCGLDTQIWSTSRSLPNEADEFCIQH